MEIVNKKVSDLIPYVNNPRKNDNAVDFLIEYQGKQHFEPVDFFGGEEIFQYQQHNDFLKREYCKYNNIELIEINYIEFKNMDNILNKHINKGE